MARSEHLPIYKAAYDLCLHVERVVQKFPRYHKYTLGTDLREGARRVLGLVVRANARRDKAPVLLEVREEVEALKATTNENNPNNAWNVNFNDGNVNANNKTNNNYVRAVRGGSCRRS